uniref:Cilia- and flagella-associated protein 91 n=1 Tax=Fundulus heteroclitus TaxID=8078 RepID=A0A3Q2PQ84_FUNHE
MKPCVTDPVYTVSSEVDHNKANFKAYAANNRFRIVPEFGPMFSNQPRYTLKLDPAVPLPSYSDYPWQGHAEQRRETLQRLAGVPDVTLAPLLDSVSPNAETCHVTGADYWKYFKRPLMAFEQRFPPDVVFEFSGEDFEASDEEQQPAQRSVGVQTDYRESETQTDPYSPAYVLQPGTTPSELLQLAALTWGRGLPAGLAEVEMIERARAKRLWEASLPPLHDRSQLDKRRRMMEEMEAKEWAFREGEIQKLQEARLAVLEELLKQRDEAQKDAKYDRLAQIYSKHLRDREHKLKKSHSDYMRKLEAKRKNVEGKLQRGDIVTDFLTQKDNITKGNMKQFKSYYVDTYEGVIKDLSKNTTADPRNGHIVTGFICDPTEEEGKDMTEKALRFLTKKEKPLPPPVTPTVESPPEEDEQSELAVIYLQKLLRGRSIQYQMFKGKENNLELIRELRKVHALQSEEQQAQKADKAFIMTLKKERDQQMQQASQEEARQAAVVGRDLAQLFDTLSKELVRLQEERRIHAFTLLAERERRRREAEESGRRQVEERRLQVHQESVDMYLEDMILGQVDRVADDHAREEITRKAKQLNDVAYAMEKSKDSCQSEEIVAEMVYSFLVPEVERIRVRQGVRLKQQRHLEAARSIIQGPEAPAGIPQPETPQASASGVKTSSQAEEQMTSEEEQGTRAQPSPAPSNEGNDD